MAHHAGLHTEPGEVIVDLADDFVGKAVAENRPWPLTVERAGVLGEKGGLFDRRQFGGRDAHDCDRTPLCGLNNQPKTFTALAITSASVVNETIACTVIIAFARRVIGMVSVGEKATTLVMLT